MSSPAPPPVTIQLNSVEAIERLIGGNNEIEIGIRNNVIQKFAEKHLKPLLNSDITHKFYQDAALAIRTLQQAAVEKAIGTFAQSGWDKKFTPTPELKKSVDAHIDEAIKKYIKNSVDDAVAKWTETKIASVIKDRVDSHIIDRINTGVAYALHEIQANIKVPV